MVVGTSIAMVIGSYHRTLRTLGLSKLFHVKHLKTVSGHLVHQPILNCDLKRYPLDDALQLL